MKRIVSRRREAEDEEANNETEVKKRHREQMERTGETLD